ncbi:MULTISPECIES: DivIVA domain-containing protein [Cellulomonas]|uniref:DivIVA domain-containing protein n=1 Tax=Cellulomonas iranensis TaxID=76862 RepID=A0ABU0GEQ2_9CELL|nr:MULTISPECIES: DivIVA domain-containing protein [Cellulomonas]MBO9569693.1 DivIVA domain-containing protein [Cellulomonas iranensis]MDQ0423840.1 DivIVA domain-containing protein [Cellulomonas iranensis]UCN13406.1 DivIVA domain-containing protein [Cellulomonas iranensis]
MSDGMFRTVSGLRRGYDPDEVDEFFSHARAVYEQGPAGTMSGADVRTVAFDMVRGGYVTAAVDAALDRLEAAFVARHRAQFVADNGQDAWMAHLGTQARTLYGRLGRPDGDRFAPPEGRRPGYEPADVDELCHRLVAYFDTGAPLTAAEVRSATFRRRNGRNGYAEGPVDAFVARAVEVLLGVE